MLRYFWVFIGTFLVDVVPFPLPPAFTVMVFLQIKFDLNIWLVIVTGVLGSVLGRYVLTLYIPKLSSKIFNAEKNKEIKLLGEKFSQKGIKGQLFILIYSLLPLPTTPLFIASGMAKLKPFYVIIPFLIGKITSDTISVLIGKYAVENSEDLFSGIISWKSISGLVFGMLLLFTIVFVDWTTFLSKKKIRLKFKVLK